jgi:hypothetical protein
MVLNPPPQPLSSLLPASCLPPINSKFAPHLYIYIYIAGNGIPPIEDKIHFLSSGPLFIPQLCSVARNVIHSLQKSSQIGNISSQALKLYTLSVLYSTLL